MRKKQYRETLDYLYTQLPMFQRVGNVAFKKDLGNIKKLCKALGHPESVFKSIHLAGTNGKGSTAHLIASALQAAGYKTALYTSPHYKDFRERIKIDGQLMDGGFVIDFVRENRSLFESIKPSFFEITVAMAFCYFRKAKVDVAVIETGLGGRLDSTNVIQPELSVITNISFDHQNLLGNTLVKIAREKAGIIKKGVPVIVGEEQQAVKSVFQKKAKQQSSSLRFANRTYRAELIRSDFQYTYYRIYKRGELYIKQLKVNLHGKFQSKNIVTALKALDTLPGFSISLKAIKKGFQNLKESTYYIGRWQQLTERPLVIADSAHNEAGLKMVTKALDKLPKNDLHFVFGTVNDKDLSKVLKLLPKTAKYYFAKANIPRGLDAEVLKQEAKSFDLDGKAYQSVAKAYAAAKGKAKADDLIFVGGSIFVVAEVL